MVKAYVLIKTASGKENQSLREILGLSVTEEAHKVFGPYDIIAEIKARDMESVIEIVVGKLRHIDGIVDTQTLLSIDEEIDMTTTSIGQ
jgi:DNA-binding Lrp family transcriptional regulator